MGLASGMSDESDADEVLFSPDQVRLTVDVAHELTRLRGDHGRLTLQKFSRYPLLVQLLGEGDLMDGFAAFTREMDRLKRGNKYEAAAAWSITADADSVLDRLQRTAEELSDDEIRDQRTARHWSDRGMAGVAHDLVAFASIRGAAGRDLIGIGVHGGIDNGLIVQIVQVVSVSLRRRSPLVTIQALPDRATPPEAIDIDLERVEPDSRDVSDGMETRRHRIQIELPAGDAVAGERIVQLSVLARRSPTPVFFLEDYTERHSKARVTFSVHRTLVVVEVVSVT